MNRLFLLLLICTFYSCDPAFRVVLSNNSNASRSVTIMESNKQKFASTNFINIANSPDSVFYSSRETAPLVAKDTMSKSYTFILEKGKSALLQGGFGFIDYKQKIILDDRDTIIIKKDERAKIKGFPIGHTVKIVSENTRTK